MCSSDLVKTKREGWAKETKKKTELKIERVEVLMMVGRNVQRLCSGRGVDRGSEHTMSGGRWTTGRTGRTETAHWHG